MLDFVAENAGAGRIAHARARIVYVNAAKREVVDPLSFKGFSQAFDALQKQ